MEKIKYILIAVVALFALNSCEDYSELERNTNKPNQVPAGLVLNGVLNDLYESPWSLEHRQNQFWACNYNYYGTNEYWAAATLRFMTLKNIEKMKEEALRNGANEVNPYSALGKFLTAVFYVRMTQRVGDLPLTQALKGLENTSPKYDNQKQIYIAVLNLLEEANSDLAALIAENDKTLQGDIYLNNDMAKWQKVVNSFKLRVLISLSKKENDADLNVKAKFAAVINNPTKYPLMTSLSDNVEFKYNGSTNLYPLNPGNRGFDKGRYNTAATYIGLLTSLKDPRVFVTANPAKKKLANGIAATDFAAYVGASSGESLDNMSSNAGKGEYSFVNQKRYYGSLTGPEAAVQFGYAEQCFNVAEAIHRGWVAGSADTYYTNGIKASMEFFGVKDGSVLTITDQDNDAVLGTVTADVTAYLNQASVKYAGNNATGLKQILEQKYLAFFQQSGQEAFFNFRRTGLPVFLTGPGTGNNGVIPKRWLYPVAEKTNNEQNYSSAVSAQFGSEGDNLNSDLWIEKN
ncbi:MAG: SusD/RagB family nutrient-binding outer membrane lipoprotein [Azospira oryzae]|nr:MAG: SusD/RagB family nutrient-binding outer membrane lipoprotein [Azospira oryzae]